MDAKEIVQRMKRDAKRDALREKNGEVPCDTLVYVFDHDAKNVYDETVSQLTNAGYKFIDLNQCVEVKPQDYSLSLNDCGYKDESEKLIIKNVRRSDAFKRCRILAYKLNKLEKVVDNQTVLLIRYNDLFLQDETFRENDRNTLYSIIRKWLKDGYVFNQVSSNVRLKAFVLAETKESLQDFCMYGDYVKNNQ